MALVCKGSVTFSEVEWWKKEKNSLNFEWTAESKPIKLNKENNSSF